MKDPVDKYFKTTKINKLTSCFFISCIVLFTMLLIVGVGHIYLDDLLEFIHLIRYSGYKDLEYYSYPYTDRKTEKNGKSLRYIRKANWFFAVCSGAAAFSVKRIPEFTKQVDHLLTGSPFGNMQKTAMNHLRFFSR